MLKNKWFLRFQSPEMGDDGMGQSSGGDPAPNQDVTATPETEQTPVTDEKKDNPVAKSFSQEEVDALIGKRLAKAQRAWEREQQSKAAAPKIDVQVSGNETPEDLQSLVLTKAQELAQKQEAARVEQARHQAFDEKADAVREKYEDFDQLVSNPNLTITKTMAEVIQESDIGPEVAYHLGKNPHEAARIAALSPVQQAREVTKLEARLIAEPPVKKVTSAPAPLSPVTTKGTPSKTYDTTDPRSTETMSVEEWMAAEKRRMVEKFKAGKR